MAFASVGTPYGKFGPNKPDANQSIYKVENRPMFNYGRYSGNYFDRAERIRMELNVPADWVAKSSKKDGGVRFTDPNNVHNNLRVMPGRWDARFSNSTEPYTIRYIGSPIDQFGVPIPNSKGMEQNRSGELHVPLRNFKFYNH